MLTIAADPKRLGVKIGFTAVSHSWGSAMTHHPHVHMIVPGGGISLDRSQWITKRPNFFAARARALETVPPADDRQAHSRARRRPVDVPRRARRPPQYRGV